MHDYLFPAEVVRFAFVAGIIVSIVLYERRHLTTGSIVVPGYIAIFMIQPLVIVASMLNALGSYWFVNKALPRWILLYGRTRFTVLALVSIAVQAMMLKLSPAGPYLWESDVPLFVGAGYVVPALIAHDMSRQGIRKTVGTVIGAGALVAVPIGVALAFDLPGVNDLAPLLGFGVLSVRPQWIPLAVLLSAAVAWGLLRNYRLRSGGFVGAAYLGLLAVRPLQVLFVVAVGTVTYVVVTRSLMSRMILFGRRKFAAMLLVASAFSWSSMWFGQQIIGLDVSHYVTLSSVSLTPLFVAGLLANDMERSGPARVLSGGAIGAAFVIPTTWTVQSILETGSVPLTWASIGLGTAAIVFRPQMVWIGTRVFAGAARLIRGRAGRHTAELALLAPQRPPSAPVIAFPSQGRLGSPHRDSARSVDEPDLVLAS